MAAPPTRNPPATRTLAERVQDDVGGAFTVGLAYIGQRLGRCGTRAKLGPTTSGTLARAAALDERYVREWLNGLVVACYLEHDPAAATYWLNDEQRSVLVDESAR